MNSDNSLMLTIFKHREQFSAAIDTAVAQPSQSSANQLKVQLLIISEWLWTLSATNADIVSGQCLYHPAKYSALANRAFCSAVLTRNLCHQLNWHGQSAQALIGAALTLDIGLALHDPGLTSGWVNYKNLPKQQQNRFINYPQASVNYLHEYRVVGKNVLKYIMEHQERLNGSGFPKGLAYAQITTPGKLLALVSKFSNLITLHPKRSCYSIKQTLRFLAHRSDEFCQQLLSCLCMIVNKPCLTMSVDISEKRQGIIHHVDHSKSLISIFELQTNKQGSLEISNNIIKVNFREIVQIIPRNEIYCEKIFSKIWSTISNASNVDNSNSSQRLKPDVKLAMLLDELDNDHPDHSKIEHLIKQQGQLEQQLIQQLTNQYPGRIFSDGFHALKMAGFHHSKSLLSLLGLYQQLNCYDFPARRILSEKVDCVINLCHRASEFTSCVRPEQAAFFGLLNLAPLYFERTVVQMPSKITADFNQLNLTDGYSLMAHKNTILQRKMTYSLAQQWDNRKPTLMALKILNKEESESTMYQDEIISVFQLAVLITHHIYHDLSFEHPLMSMTSKSLFRKMNLSVVNIEHLIADALSQAPFCELSQDLLD